MSGILKHSLGIIRTLLVWGIIGAAGIIIYQYYSAKKNVIDKSEPVKSFNIVKAKAAAIKKELNDELPVIKDKLSKTGKIIINKIKPEEEMNMKELLDVPPEPEKSNKEIDADKEIEANKTDSSINQQDIFKRQVAIVNDLMQ